MILQHATYEWHVSEASGILLCCLQFVLSPCSGDHKRRDINETTLFFNSIGASDVFFNEAMDYTINITSINVVVAFKDTLPSKYSILQGAPGT